MNNLISTKAHGVLDYLTVGTLLALPRALGWDKKVTTWMTGMAGGTLLYTALTRYELGLIKVLPMRGHLWLDAMSGLAFCAAPLLLPDEEQLVVGSLVAIGVFELAAALTTEPRPALPEQAAKSADDLHYIVADAADALSERIAGR